MNNERHETGARTSTATFIHREIFHLKPRKVDSFRARLAGEYAPSSSPQQQQQELTFDFDEWINETRRRRRRHHGRSSRYRDRWLRNEPTINGSIIQSVRQMNGCYSFDIYCRFDNPLKEIAELQALHGRQDEDKKREFSSPYATAASVAATGPPSTETQKSSSLLEPDQNVSKMNEARSSKNGVHQEDSSGKVPSENENKSFVLDSGTASNELSKDAEARADVNLRKKKMPEQHVKHEDESGPNKSAECNATATDETSSKNFIPSLSEDAKDELSEKDRETKSNKKEASDAKNGSPGQLPHQFMVMGRWENRNAHEAFFLDGGVQNFFCPLISHKVIESLPILTMWKRENGVHHRMHSNNNEEESSKTLGHFVVTRRRTLKDSSNLDRALVVVKELGCAALKATGCSVYEVCTTGHPDFNQGEILEVGIWDAWTSFLSFASQSLWRDCNESLDGFFAEKQHELTCWIRPTDQFFAQDGDK